MRKIFATACIAAVIALSCSKIEIPGKDMTGRGETASSDSLSLADPDATAETKALYANLWTIKEKGFMFGHHDDLMYGRYWYGTQGGSDTRAVCGDYPAVYSLDLSEMVDDRYNSDRDANALRIKCIEEAYDRGMVIIACMHLDNPLTGGDAWDNSSSHVVSEILDEYSQVHDEYVSWMNRLADVCLSLKGSDGKQIPLIMRMYHEHTQTWSWWGSSCCSEQEFINLWRWTVKYLRDERGVHNLIYAVSPQMDSQKTDEDFLFRWPGDEWVDFIGMDCYQGINNAVFTANLKAISRVSLDKCKPCGVTETGVEGFTKATYWSENIHAPMTGRQVSLLVTWRNKYVGANEADTHFFSVYPGHPSEKDFVKMYNQTNTLFCNDLPDMYAMPEGMSVE